MFSNVTFMLGEVLGVRIRSAAVAEPLTIQLVDILSFVLRET